MTRTRIYLGDEERTLLDRLSRATGASASELIRQSSAVHSAVLKGTRVRF